MPQPKENSPIKRDILFRVHLLYAAFVLIAALVFARLIWVQLFSSEVAYNAERLEGRIFTDEIIPARRGNILTRDGEPLATSLFRYQVEMDYGSPGFDSLRTFREQSDSLAKLLALYFRDKSAAAYAQAMQREHARRYRVTYRKDTLVPRSEGGLARWWDRMRGEEFLTVKLYDTLRDHTPVALFPREIDYTEWQTLRRYPILNWNMGMTYRLRERDERVYPQGELARRTIGQVGDKGNYGVEYVLRDVLEGRDGKARRQRIARGFYGRVVGGDNSEPEDGLDVVTTLDLEMQDVADRALRRQLEAQNALWGTALVMEVATGDLLAMANLSRTKSGAYAEVKNHALSSRMEPGSTFKLAALLALVDDAGMSLDETFDTGNGARVKVGRTTVQDSHGLPPLNLKDAVAHSSNVFFARAVYETYKDDPERYVDYLRHLHLDRTVGLEEFGAVAPIFPAPGMKIWYPDVSIVNMGYGYAIELTPLHTLTLYNAVANDGCMVAPRLVREIRRGGEVVDTFYRLIRPRPNFYSHFTTAIHGLRYEDTADAPDFASVWREIEPRIEGLPLVAHNSPFDEGCLRAVFELYGMPWPGYTFYCTCRASRRTFGSRLPNHQLHTVSAACGFELENHHHALADAEACAQIALKIL